MIPETVATQLSIQGVQFTVSCIQGAQLSLPVDQCGSLKNKTKQKGRKIVPETVAIQTFKLPEFDTASLIFAIPSSSIVALRKDKVSTSFLDTTSEISST